MARRRMTLKRIDPWSVLKFGFVANLALLGVAMLAFAVIWFVIQRLGLIERVCAVALELGFERCGINSGNLFRALLLLGLLGVVVNTGLLVFFTFLHNLIADLVGGITVTLEEEGVARGATMTARNVPEPAPLDRPAYPEAVVEPEPLSRVGGYGASPPLADVEASRPWAASAPAEETWRAADPDTARARRSATSRPEPEPEPELEPEPTPATTRTSEPVTSDELFGPRWRSS